MCQHPRSVLTYRQLRSEGRGRRSIDADLRAGVLTRIRRGVYATAHACAPAVAAAAHGGTLACVSAARHRGLWVLDGGTAPHVWLDRGGHRHAHALDGCRCVEHWDRGARDTFGQPSMAQILAQILACRGVEEFFVATESALRQEMLPPPERAKLAAVLTAEGRDALAFARGDADSGLESLLRWRLRRHGLSVRTQVRVVGVGRVDFLIGERLIVEVDGADNHDGPSHRHKDLVRDAHAAMWGYATLRFDYAMVVHDWELVEAAILATLARQAA